MTKKEKEARKEDAIKYLRTILKPGDTVYTILKQVSQTGMSRRIEVCIPSTDREGKATIHRITWYVGNALGYKESDKGGLVVGGAGMDMGFHVVYSLSSVLFRDAFHCIGKDCTSNDHSNDRDGSWDRLKNKGRLHSDGGYALNQAWI